MEGPGISRFEFHEDEVLADKVDRMKEGENVSYRLVHDSSGAEENVLDPFSFLLSKMGSCEGNSFSSRPGLGDETFSRKYEKSLLPLSFQGGGGGEPPFRERMTEKLRVVSCGLTPPQNLPTGGRKEVTVSKKFTSSVGKCQAKLAPSRNHGKIWSPDRKFRRTECLGTESFLIKFHLI